MDKKELIDIMKSIALCTGYCITGDICSRCKYNNNLKMCRMIRYGEFEKIVEG